MIQTEHIAMQHSQQLNLHIRNMIKASGGKISFAEFMQQALYAPGLGYYSAGNIKFGPQGDFITAPEIGTLFAKCLAVQCAEVLALTSGQDILEIGAGSGQLAYDLLQTLEQQQVAITNYFILELSADLRNRQQEKVLTLPTTLKNKITWLDSLPNTPINGVILANEVIDAMPVARFHYAENTLQEYYVSANHKQFITVLDTASTALYNTFRQTHLADIVSQPYSSEINLWLPSWIRSLNTCLAAGAILLCDYGFSRHEYYHPQRNNGTLMCHYQHHNHPNAMLNIGLQDITAHVDFTTIAEAASSCDLTVAGYINLAGFLLNCGITEFLPANSIRHSQEVNILTSPAEMGEIFKCMALTRNVNHTLRGFCQFDKKHCL